MLKPRIFVVYLTEHLQPLYEVNSFLILLPFTSGEAGLPRSERSFPHPQLSSSADVWAQICLPRTYFPSPRHPSCVCNAVELAAVIPDPSKGKFTSSGSHFMLLTLPPGVTSLMSSLTPWSGRQQCSHSFLQHGVCLPISLSWSLSQSALHPSSTIALLPPTLGTGKSKSKAKAQTLGGFLYCVFMWLR